MAEISILMPCRNASGTVGAAIESVLNQTFRAFELLVWDDGSDDRTYELLRAAAALDGRIKIVGHDRVGLVNALMNLAAAARGQFLARMDADDINRPTRLERQLELLRQNPAMGLCGCQHETFGGVSGSGRLRYDEWINGLVDPESIRLEMFIECPIAHPTFLLRREAYAAVGGYSDPCWPEDYELVLKLAEAGYALGKVPEVLFRWRDYPARTSLRDPRYGEDRFRALKRHYLSKLYAPRLDTLYQWGAGEVGKRWLREWETPRPRAVVDIHPRKLGTRIHGYDVIAPEELPPPGEAFTVILVGAPAAREDIRNWLGPRGYREGKDYLFLA